LDDFLNRDSPLFHGLNLFAAAFRRFRWVTQWLVRLLSPQVAVIVCEAFLVFTAEGSGMRVAPG
jgi:hypothetical protein